MVVMVVMVVEVEGENVYARINEGILNSCLAVSFVVLDGFLRLLLTWLISS